MQDNFVSSDREFLNNFPKNSRAASLFTHLSNSEFFGKDALT